MKEKKLSKGLYKQLLEKPIHQFTHKHSEFSNGILKEVVQEMIKRSIKETFGDNIPEGIHKEDLMQLAWMIRGIIPTSGIKTLSYYIDNYGHKLCNKHIQKLVSHYPR